MAVTATSTCCEGKRSAGTCSSNPASQRGSLETDPGGLLRAAHPGTARMPATTSPGSHLQLRSIGNRLDLANVVRTRHLWDSKRVFCTLQADPTKLSSSSRGSKKAKPWAAPVPTRPSSLPPHPRTYDCCDRCAGAQLRGMECDKPRSQTADCHGIRDKDCCLTPPQNVLELAIKLVDNIICSCFFCTLSLFLSVI